MISKIINRAASLRELAANPKSFSNCPDLHGGVPLEENGVASELRTPNSESLTLPLVHSKVFPKF